MLNFFTVNLIAIFAFSQNQLILNAELIFNHSAKNECKYAYFDKIN
jgi:hypothetical protein